MRIAAIFKSDLRTARGLRLPLRIGMFIMFGSMGVYYLLYRTGRPELALPLVVGLLSLVFVLKVKWRLRGRLWFWIAVVVLTLLQNLLVLVIPWTDKWVPAVVTIPIATGYLVGLIALLSVLEALFDGREAAGMAVSDAEMRTRRRARRRRPRV